MRRLIAIFLLVLLPLQAVWAAVTPYCPHDRQPDSQQHAPLHLGHHEHQHQGGGEQTSNPATAMGDHDHHCCASVSLLPASLSLPGPLPQAELVATLLASYASFDATRIERPNWATSS